MQRILNDEWHETGQIWLNPYGTSPHLRLARRKRGGAGTATINIIRPQGTVG
jgi:hypothetical protein